MNVLPITTAKSSTLAKTTVKKSTKSESAIAFGATKVDMDKTVRNAYESNPNFRAIVDKYAASKIGNLVLTAVDWFTAWGDIAYGFPVSKTVKIKATETYRGYKNNEIICSLIYHEDDNYQKANVYWGK